MQRWSGFGHGMHGVTFGACMTLHLVHHSISQLCARGQTRHRVGTRPSSSKSNVE